MSLITTWPSRVCLNCSSSPSLLSWPPSRPKSVEVRKLMRKYIKRSKIWMTLSKIPSSSNVPRCLDPISIFSALKHLMKKVLERLMGTAVALEDGEEEEAEHTSAQSAHCSLSGLCDWYTSRTKVGLWNSDGVKEVREENISIIWQINTPLQTEIQQWHSWEETHLWCHRWPTASCCCYFQGFGGFQSQSSPGLYFNLQVFWQTEVWGHIF